MASDPSTSLPDRLNRGYCGVAGREDTSAVTVMSFGSYACLAAIRASEREVAAVGAMAAAVRPVDDASA